jgi:hypothetical protein
MPTVLLRKGIGPPPNTLVEGEPAIDMTPTTPRLWVAIGGVPVLIADPAYTAAQIALLEARIAMLEQAVRELQFKTWRSVSLLPGNIIPIP